jgi:hypothetical protein
MPSLKTIKHYMKYPLMWVMLLWALTLPGHEVAVYSFMVKGSVAEATSVLEMVTSKEAASAVKQQVFQDAKTASCIVLLQQRATRFFLPSFAGAPPADEGLPAYAVNPSGSGIAAHFFPVTILPNAP